MLLENSQDLLYIILSLSILWFTVFLCWLLYQAARVLRNANNIIENLTEKLELIADAVEFMREKVDGLSKNMGVVSSLVGGFAEKFVLGKLSDKLTDVIEKSPSKKKRKAAKKK